MGLRSVKEYVNCINYGHNRAPLQNLSSHFCVINLKSCNQNYLICIRYEKINYTFKCRISDSVSFRYDKNGNLIENISYEWYANQWVKGMKYEYAFDSEGNNTLSVTYIWVDTEWVNIYSKEEYSYDDKDKLSLTTDYQWDGAQWVNSYQNEFTYGSNEELLTIVYSSWNGNSWSNPEKFENIYDSSGNITQTTISYLEEEQWLVDQTIDYEEEELDLKVLFNHKLLRMVYFEGDGENWLMESDFTLVYSEQNISGISQENSGNRMSVYPNPASSQLTFILEGLADNFQIKIFDIQGKVVISQLAENNTPISLDALNDGVYFYSLKSKGKNFSGKLVVKK